MEQEWNKNGREPNGSRMKWVGGSGLEAPTIPYDLLRNKIVCR